MRLEKQNWLWWVGITWSLLTHCRVDSDLAQKDLRVEHKGSRVTSVITRSHSLPFMGIISANVILAISIGVFAILMRHVDIIDSINRYINNIDIVRYRCLDPKTSLWLWKYWIIILYFFACKQLLCLQFRKFFVGEKMSFVCLLRF